jgi:acyl-coenzyme A thioesterase PaaI-like protein
VSKPYRFINFYPPFLGAGIRVEQDGQDPYSMRACMRLTRLNRNLHGAHFGGSLYALCDPFFALILIRCLGGEYVVWDRSAYIDFLRPGRGTVCANFHIPPEQVDEIRRRADAGETLEPIFQVDVFDKAGQVIAHVEKRLYVRRRNDR